jgi:hypothetical protein
MIINYPYANNQRVIIFDFDVPNKLIFTNAKTLLKSICMHADPSY